MDIYREKFLRKLLCSEYSEAYDLYMLSEELMDIVDKNLSILFPSKDLENPEETQEPETETLEDVNFNRYILYTHYCPMLCYNGDLDRLKNTLSDGRIKVDHTSVIWAAAGGSLAVLQWLHKTLFGREMFLLAELGPAAVESDNVQILDWMKQKGYTYPVSSWNAVKSRDVAFWLFKEKIPWSSTTTAFAIEQKDRRKLIRWYIDHNCPWSKHTITAAILNKHYELLDFLLYTDCPMDYVFFSQLTEYDDYEKIMDIIEKDRSSHCVMTRQRYKKIRSSIADDIQHTEKITESHQPRKKFTYNDSSLFIGECIQL